jgi:hypothetical protein
MCVWIAVCMCSFRKENLCRQEEECLYFVCLMHLSLSLVAMLWLPLEVQVIVLHKNVQSSSVGFVNCHLITHLDISVEQRQIWLTVRTSFRRRFNLSDKSSASEAWCLGFLGYKTCCLTVESSVFSSAFLNVACSWRPN